MVVVLGLLLLVATMSFNLKGAHAQSACSSNSQAYIVVRGDTLARIAARYNTGWKSLASYNHIANPNLIFLNQVVCIPGKGSASSGSTSPLSSRIQSSAKGNVFPYGTCTWWANERYFDVHGIYVPWMSNSDAWEWTARAYQFGWHVSSRPKVGSIIDLQPWVQGAYGLGHVAYVEQVLRNGKVVASNMAWGGNPWQVTYVQFSPGPGVTFISQP